MLTRNRTRLQQQRPATEAEPFGWLPESLLSHILQIAVRDLSTRPDNDCLLFSSRQGSNSRALFVLLSVCRRWHGMVSVDPCFMRYKRLQLLSRASYANDWIHLIKDGKNRNYKQRKLPSTLVLEYPSGLKPRYSSPTIQSEEPSRTQPEHLLQRGTASRQLPPALCSTTSLEVQSMKVQPQPAVQNIAGHAFSLTVDAATDQSLSLTGSVHTKLKMEVQGQRKRSVAEQASFPSSALLLQVQLAVPAAVSNCAGSGAKGRERAMSEHRHEQQQQQQGGSAAAAAGAAAGAHAVERTLLAAASDGAQRPAVLDSMAGAAALGTSQQQHQQHQQPISDASKACSAASQVLPLLQAMCADLVELDQHYNAGILVKVVLSYGGTSGTGTAAQAGTAMTPGRTPAAHCRSCKPQQPSTQQHHAGVMSLVAQQLAEVLVSYYIAVELGSVETCRSKASSSAAQAVLYLIPTASRFIRRVPYQPGQ